MSRIIADHQVIIDELLALLRKRVTSEIYQLSSPFLSQYYLQLDPSDLDSYSNDELYSMAWSHWELLQLRKEKTIKLKVFNPTIEQDGFTSPYTVIQLSIDDMPFLVDSIRMAVVGMGYDIHLMVHTGGIFVDRDYRGRIKKVEPYSSTNEEMKLTEAPVACYIDHLADAEEIEHLRLCLEKVLVDIMFSVNDWDDMLKVLAEETEALRQNTISGQSDSFADSISFLEWLAKDNFTFLGCVEYKLSGSAKQRSIDFVHNSGLGVFHDEPPVLKVPLSQMTEKARLLQADPSVQVVICKSDMRATVHRPVDMDLVVVKQFDKQGNHIGDRQFYGLFTSNSFSTHPINIPILKNKVNDVLLNLDVPPVSYAGKNLKYLLSTLPRDALFECDIDELSNLAQGILQLQERRKLRLFSYRSIFGSMLSCLVFLPRDNFNTEIVYKMQSKLEKCFSALGSSFTTSFGRSALARIHYSLHVDPNKLFDLNLKEIEDSLAKMSRTWQDDLHRFLTKAHSIEQRNALWRLYAYAFPAGYREDFSPEEAVKDISKLESLSLDNHLEMSFYSRAGEDNLMRLKFFHAQDTIALSDTLPMFENMGLRVIGEHPYELNLKDGLVFWINDFSLQYKPVHDTSNSRFGNLLKDTMSAVWYGHAENDRLNRLVLSAELDWRQVSIFRAYTRYMRQAGFTYSQQYIEDTLTDYPEIVKQLFIYFDRRFNPEEQFSADNLQLHADTIISSMETVSSLDSDQILRRFLELMNATLRINYYSDAYQNGEINYLSIKLSPSLISGLPKPLPEYELYVYSPRFEGIHLRASKVARGGIRWSDRREDFRTEVLSLMKAQQVKNAVIVPQGAKGGFVVKNLPAASTREEIMQEGVRCYKEFISALLAVTDNIIDGSIIPPEKVVCFDDSDSYLVVAADKGTATFSDTANSIAIAKGYWLGDAFASGGSAGYDHKKMGITARGAWVAAEEHFTNLGINLAKDPVKVIGIGDMSGDVFGNGMLLSESIKLVAAFNHLHIFIDPDPNSKKSFRERKRLFQLPRSSWDDYDRGLISSGGGVYKRSSKLINISPEIKHLLDIDAESLTPDQLIKSILSSPVDLLWNGGVGTFVKANGETDIDAGDRSNDAIRINAEMLRVKVICEGGNLGLTQKARIEYSLAGGLMNTDFIDNSAGVDCSDHEVNIKILLQDVARSTELDNDTRNKLLLSMTDEIGELVLSHNVQQTRAITINTAQGIHYFNLYQRYMQYLQQSGRLDPVVESLPTDQELVDRLAKGIGMTRPEIATLFSYSKIDTKEKLLSSELLDDLYFNVYLQEAFPSVLYEKYSNFAHSHRLRKEIVATQLTNHLVADMGLSFVYQMQDETNAETQDVARAYIIAGNIFSLTDLIRQVDSLGVETPIEVRQDIMLGITSLIRRSSRWLLRQKNIHRNIPMAIERFKQPVEKLFQRLPKLLLGNTKEIFDKEQQSLEDSGVPAELALKIAGMKGMYHAWNIVTLALEQDVELFRVAKIYIMIADRLDLFWFREQIDAYPSGTRWAILAKASYKGDLDNIQRDLTRAIIEFETKARSIPGRLRAWIEHHADTIDRWNTILASLRGMDAKDFAILSIAIRNLKDLA